MGRTLASNIRFLVHTYRLTSFLPHLALGSSPLADNKGKIISVIQTRAPAGETYWFRWGGWYDIPPTPNLTIFLGKYLQRVPSLAALVLSDESYTVTGQFVYINTPKYPWQYFFDEGTIEKLEAYSSTVPNPDKPSNDIYINAIGQQVRHPVRLQVPSSTLNASLPDPINGVVLFPSFSVGLENSDGHFDDYKIVDSANRPIDVLKSNVDNPTLADFKTIRVGKIESVTTTPKVITIKALDPYTTLSEEVCKPYTGQVFADLPEDLAGKKMPAAWGQIDQAPRIALGETRFALCDPVYKPDATGFTRNPDFSFSGSGEEPVSFRTAGPKKIGTIITSLIAQISDIAYVEGLWDVTETNKYIDICPEVGIYHKGGAVKKLVGDILRNDLAFLIVKNDGRLTLRRWGVDYDRHEIPSWQITKPPKIETSDTKYFMSSCSIEYLHQEDSNTYNGYYLHDAEERGIYLKWRKRARKEFQTRLKNEGDVKALAARLLARFGRQTKLIHLSTGYDTSQINLLDTVVTDITINGRRLAKGNHFIVRKVNPAQDTLLLEGVV